MSDNLTALREMLDRILAEASRDLDAQTAARAADLDQRERDLAEAMECASVDTAARNAWRQSAEHRSQQVLALVDAQLQYWKPGCNTYAVLNSLRKQIEAL